MPRQDRLDAIAELSNRQLGVLARHQLRAAGWTDGQIDHEIRFERWTSPAWGVVATQNAPLDQDQRLWLGVLHAGPAAVLSHLTAVRSAGVKWKGDDTIDVLTRKGDLVAPLPGFFFHQTRRPYERWVSQSLAGPPRLRVEHAALLTAERDRRTRRAVGLLAACVQQRITTAEKLVAAAPQIRKLRNGKLFLAALGDIAGGAQSFAEIDLGRLCEQAGLPAPTRQTVRLDEQGRRRYLDCEWCLADGRIIVLEVDGSFHLEVGNWWRDMKRERQVVITRSTVLRCSSIELRLDPWDVLRDLMKVGLPRDRGSVWVS